MELNTAEKFLLLIMHPEKSRYVISEQMINPGLFGSILVDLSMEGKIEIKDKKVISNSSYTKISQAHNILLSKIAASKRTKRIKSWIAAFAWNARKYRYMILHDMSMKGLIKLEDKRFLIFSYKSANLLNKNARQSLLDNLKDTILNNRAVDGEIESLLGIIQACKMHKIITRNKVDLKIVKSNLKEIVKQDSISKEVHQVISEMQAATVGVVVATQ